MSKQYTWFIEPLDAHTNHVISERVSADDNFSESLCNEGVTVEYLWRCPRKIINALERSRPQLNLRFNIYVQQGKGKVRQWIFSKKRKNGKI